LTLIDEGQLYYRGRNAVELAGSEPFSRAVQWFWNQDQPFQVFTDRPGLVNLRPRSSPVREFQRRLLELSDRDVGGYDLSIPNALSTGWRILELFLQCLVGRSNVRLEDAGDHLQRAWAPKSPDLAGLLNAALILCMDHELNASSFTARVVASAESSLYEVVLAGLCALRGHRHGGMSLLCYQLVAELEGTNTVRTILVEWQREKGFVPGFGHPLYLTGDVRAKALLRMLKKTRVGQSQAKLVAQAVQVLRKPATIDLMLAALARAYDLPASSPFTIFALGRIAGWIGHAIEQHRQGGLIRPRARYIGRMPGDLL